MSMKKQFVYDEYWTWPSNSYSFCESIAKSCFATVLGVYPRKRHLFDYKKKLKI